MTSGLLNLPWWGDVIACLILVQITIAGVTVYLHRCQAHRALDVHPIVSHFFRAWLWMTTGMITKEWAAIHRKHHAKCETAEDPHSPQELGINKVLWTGVVLYVKESHKPETMTRYGHGTPDDWIERHLYTPHATMGPTLLLFLSFALFGFAGVAVWAIQMLWIPFWAAGVVNGLGHWWGYRNFVTDDTATNLTPWGVWIGGEELHNNHHAFPSSAKFALRKWELDIGWVAIKACEKVGLAKVLRVAPSLNVRPNISVPDSDTLKALLAIRFQAMTDFQRSVLKPALYEEASATGGKVRSLLPRKLRAALADDGRWLKPDARQQLQCWIAQRPRIRALVEHRARLAAVLEARSQTATDTLHHLQDWCHEAEASGIRALQDFSARLKGYSLQTAHA